jgi:hypothetical protein
MPPDTRTVEEKIEALNHISKLQMWGAYQARIEQQAEEKPIREANQSKYHRLGTFTKINDWLTITEHFETTGERKMYYSAIVDGKRINHLFEKPEEAVLFGLGVKYEGHNTQFHHYAARMLPGYVEQNNDK